MQVDVFIAVFTLIFFAELPDKTAFATFLMATKGRAGAIFTGVALAFLVQSLVAVAFGGMLGLLPEKGVHIAAGLMFIAFAAHTFFFHDKEEKEAKEETPAVPRRAHFFGAAAKAFMVIFIAEWGDLTQIATASLAARYHQAPMTVLAAATLALWTVTAIAVVAGRKIGHALPTGLLKNISAVFMTLAGLYFIAGALY